MNRKLPPLNALRAFEAAARTGSFKDAAEELHVSQSAISHQIKHLEQVLRVRLFDRGARAVTLTGVGGGYLPYLQKAFDFIADGTRILTHEQRDDILTLRTYSTFAVRWLIPRLAGLQAQHPDLQIRLITAQNDPDFNGRDIDIAVVIGRATRSDLHYEYLFRPTLFTVCNPRILNDDGRLQSPADLARRTILQVHSSPDDWPTWLQAAGGCEVDLAAGLSFDSYDHALRMAARGLGVALAMQPYVSEDFAAGLLVNPLPDHVPPAPGDWWLAYPPASAEAGKIKAFQAWLIAEIESDPELSPLRASGCAHRPGGANG